jgi:hypothetical protein
MRTITLLCALVLLTSCNKAPAPPDGGNVGKHGGPTDSSPIKISDDSIRINRPTHFRVHGAKLASVKDLNHAPTYLGYKCSPGDDGATGDCGATQCPTGSTTATPVSAACYVELDDLNAWSMDVRDVSDANVVSVVATLSWASSSKDTVRIDLPNGYTVQDGSPGVDLLPSANHAKSASLSVNGANTPLYTFSCPQGSLAKPAMCAKIGYYCPASASSCVP